MGPSAHVLAVAAVAGALGFVFIVVILHIVRGEISPRTRGISRYATTPTFVVMTVGFLSLAISLAAVAFAQRSRLLAIAAAALVMVAATPQGSGDPRGGRLIAHTLSGLGFFASAAAGMFLTSSRSPSALGTLPVVAVALFFASLAGVPGISRIPGLLQRACFLSFVAWIVAAA